jgi:transcriptional regulator with XRE-family HTH domain
MYHKNSCMREKSNAQAIPATDALQTPLGERLKLLRTIHQISLDELAQRTGLTKSYLSKVERGVSEPSLATVLRLCEAYSITTGQLLGEEATDDLIQLTRKDERTPLKRLKHYDGYVYEALASKRANKVMQPFVMYPPFKSTVSKIDLVAHQGQELIYVIKGEIEFITYGNTLRLSAGDSAYFDSTVPHRFLSLGKTQAEALIVVVGMQAS